MNDAARESARPLDKRPFFWMLGILGIMVLIVLGFRFAGDQKLHNTTLWQRFRPVTLVSPPQTATPVEVQDTRRIAWVVMQTEKGLYFLTGAKHVLPAGSKVVVQTNEHWDSPTRANGRGAWVFRSSRAEQACRWSSLRGVSHATAKSPASRLLHKTRGAAGVANRGVMSRASRATWAST